MAWFTKMSISPTKPLWNITAKFTFVFDKICSMFRACLITTTDSHSCAFTADKLFFFKVFVIIYLVTLLQTSKVGLLTFKTLIIGKFTHCKVLKLSVKPVVGILKSWILVKIFKFGSLHRFLYNYLFKFLLFFNFFINCRTLFGWHALFTVWTINIIKNNSWTIVLFLDQIF